MSYESGWMYFRWVKPNYYSKTLAPEIKFFSKYRPCDNGDEVVNVGGMVHIKETDGVTPKRTWADPDMSVQHIYPIMLCAYGQARIYMPPGDLFHITVMDNRSEIVEICNFVRMPDWRSD